MEKLSKIKNDELLRHKNLKYEKVFFNLKELHGDKSIYLGQSILALIALNQSSAYSDAMNKSFVIELFSSLIEELGITPEELKHELNQREKWHLEQ